MYFMSISPIWKKKIKNNCFHGKFLIRVFCEYFTDLKKSSNFSLLLILLQGLYYFIKSPKIILILGIIQNRDSILSRGHKSESMNGFFKLKYRMSEKFAIQIFALIFKLSLVIHFYIARSFLDFYKIICLFGLSQLHCIGFPTDDTLEKNNFCLKKVQNTKKL